MLRFSIGLLMLIGGCSPRAGDATQPFPDATAKRLWIATTAELTDDALRVTIPLTEEAWGRPVTLRTRGFKFDEYAVWVTLPRSDGTAITVYLSDDELTKGTDNRAGIADLCTGLMESNAPPPPDHEGGWGSASMGEYMAMTTQLLGDRIVLTDTVLLFNAVLEERPERLVVGIWTHQFGKQSGEVKIDYKADPDTVVPVPVFH